VIQILEVVNNVQCIVFYSDALHGGV